MITELICFICGFLLAELINLRYSYGIKEGIAELKDFWNNYYDE